MDINQLVSKELSKNILTNYFLKGMNTDTSDMLISNELYRYAENIRVITNTDNNSGEVRLIDGNSRVKIVTTINSEEILIDEGDILAFDSIRNIGILIVRHKIYNVELDIPTFKWTLYRLDLGNVTEDGDLLKVEWTKIFGPCDEQIWPDEWDGKSKVISTVLRWESNKNIKLYIADGRHNIMCVNVMDEYGTAAFDLVFSYQKILLDAPHAEINNAIGYLTSAVVQYAYRLYAENGAATQLSALSNPISLYKNKYSGFAQDKQTNKSVRITIPTTNSQVLNKVQVYRITYQQIGQLPTVDLIYDTFVSSVPMVDYGGSKILTMSASEFLALYNLYTKPKILESKGDYLFAANIQYTQDDVDDNFEYFDARSYNVGAKSNGVSIFQKENDEYVIPATWPDKDAVITNDAFDPSDLYNTYNELYWENIDGYNGVGPYISWKYVKTRHTISAQDQTNNGTPTRTYRSGETYRFGIRLFDEKGNASSVKWIADIQMPNRYEFVDATRVITSDTMSWNEVEDYTIEFKINTPTENTEKNIAGYEIVQAPRTTADRCTITEGIAGHIFDVKYLYKSDDTSKRIDNRDWMTPVGFLSLQDIYAISPDNEGGLGYYKLIPSDSIGVYRSQFAMPKRNIIQIASPEYAYQPDDIKNLISSSENIYIEAVKNYYPSYVPDGETLSPYWDATITSSGGDVYDILEDVSTTLSSYYNNAIPTFSGLTSFVRSNNDYSYSLGILQNENDTKKYFINPAVIYYNRNVRGAKIFSSVSMFKEAQGAQARTDADAFRLTKETTGSHSESIHYFNYITPSNTSSGHYNSLYLKNNGNNEYTSKTQVSEVAYTESPDYSSFANNKEFTLKNSIVSIDNKSFINWTAPFIVNATSLETEAIKRLSKNDGENVAVVDDEDAEGTVFTHMMYPLGSGGRSILLKLSDNENNDFNIDYNSDVDAEGMPQICIVAIKKHCVPYGGYDSTHILNTNYISIGAFSLAGLENTTIVANGGDAFMRIFTYNCAHEWYDPTYKRFIKNATVYAVPIETDIDIQAQHSNSLYGVTTDDYRVQDKASAFDGYAQSDDSYLYNTAYGTSTDIATWVSDTRSKGLINNYDTRVHYSNLKTNNELIDSWLLFKAVDFLDVDSRYGLITALLLFKDKLIFWQENASGILSVNERSLIKDSNSSQIILGTGGVLERFDYFSTIYGQKPNQHNQTHSDSTLYWWDGHNKEILAYSDGYNIAPLTTVKQVRNYINERNENTFPMLMYNLKNKEVVCSVVGGESIAYNEQIEAFTSVYKYTPVWYCCTNGINYTISPDESHPVCLYKEDTDKSEATLFDAEVKPAIEYVVNHANQYVKTFDIQTFGGRFYGGSEVQSENDYDKHLVKDEHNTNPLSVLTFAYSTPLKLNSSTTGADVVTNREYDFRLNIPRATIQDYGGRMRGKTMQCRIESSSNNKDFSLQYITTKYRTSWS